MNSDNQHIDGDDYTWGNEPSGGAVFKGRYSLEDTMYDLPVHDLRTAAEKEQADMAALDRRLAALEATVAKLVTLLEVRL